MPRWSLEEELDYLVRHGTISLCHARPGSNKLPAPIASRQQLLDPTNISALGAPNCTSVAVGKCAATATAWKPTSSVGSVGLSILIKLELVAKGQTTRCQYCMNARHRAGLSLYGAMPALCILDDTPFCATHLGDAIRELWAAQ